MTIIAYRNGIMASDSGIHCGRALVGTMNKIIRTGDGILAGACGNTSTIYGFLDWVGSGMHDPFEMKEGDDFAGLLARPDGDVFLIDNACRLTPIYGAYHAVGSGQDVAMGAMMAGVSAFKAAEIACAIDVSCQGPVIELRHKQKRS